MKSLGTYFINTWFVLQYVCILIALKILTLLFALSYQTRLGYSEGMILGLEPVSSG